MKLIYVKSEALDMKIELEDFVERLKELAEPSITVQPAASRKFAEARDSLVDAIARLMEVDAL